MIQRIQSVYLLLVFIFALLFLIFPKGYLDINGTIFEIRSMTTYSKDGTEMLEPQGILRYLVLIVPFIIMALSVYTTVSFKNRVFQIKLGKINILLHIALVVSTFFYLDNVRNFYSGEFSYGAAVVLPLAAMVLILLANRAIRKDENLVRSADRLR